MKKILCLFILMTLGIGLAHAVSNKGGENVYVDHSGVRLSLGPADFVYVDNVGTSTVWVAFGENTTPTTNNFPIQSGKAQSFDSGGIFYVSLNCKTNEASTFTWGSFSRK